MYKRKKKIDKKYIFLIVAVTILLVIALVINIFRTKRNLNPVEKIIKDACLSISSILYKPINYIQSSIDKNKEKNDLYKKYKNLEEKYNNIKNYEITINELKKEIDELENNLDITNNLIDYESVTSTIIGRKTEYWDDYLIIDKGENQGIKKNMAVVTSDGLIGKVVSTSYLYSTVNLLTSEDFDQKISVKICIDNDQYIYGLLSGYKDKKFIIEGISENVDIKENSVVTTTGMSEIFPSGILIGYIDKISKDNFDLTMIALVTPSTDYDALRYVTILKRKTLIYD